MATLSKGGDNLSPPLWKCGNQPLFEIGFSIAATIICILLFLIYFYTMENIKLFESKQVRSHWDELEEKWYFVVADVVTILTNAPDSTDYIKKMRRRDQSLSAEWGQYVISVSMETNGGIQKLNCTDVRGLLRIIQSIPSPKAEPFKRWLAQVGSDRIAENENPGLAADRARAQYKANGYPDEWIERRMRSILIREELTGEWMRNGLTNHTEFAILSNDISKATFELTPQEHRDLKGLEKENLRDHMTDLELLFTMLGEASTTAIVKAQQPKGLQPNRQAAKQGGNIAGNARKELEAKTGERIVSTQNFLPPKPDRSRLKD